MKDLTICILFNNEYKDLENLFNSIMESYNIKGINVLLYCNCKIDYNKLNIILNNFIYHINIITKEYNMGSAYGRNQIIELCKTKYILFCDADLTLSRYLIINLYNFIKRKDIHAVTPKIYYGATNILGDKYYNMNTYTFWYNGRYNKYLNNEYDKGKFDINNLMSFTGIFMDDIKIILGGFMTTCVMINRQKFIEDDLYFDDEYFTYYEDSKFNFNKNFICCYYPFTYAIHNVELNIFKFDKFRSYLSLRNGMILNLTYKNYIGLFTIILKYIIDKRQSLKLRIRAFLYGLKLSLLKTLNKNKKFILDISEFKFIVNLSKFRTILR